MSVVRCIEDTVQGVCEDLSGFSALLVANFVRLFCPLLVTELHVKVRVS